VKVVKEGSDYDREFPKGMGRRWSFCGFCIMIPTSDDFGMTFISSFYSCTLHPTGNTGLAMTVPFDSIALPGLAELTSCVMDPAYTFDDFGRYFVPGTQNNRI